MLYIDRGNHYFILAFTCTGFNRVLYIDPVDRNATAVNVVRKKDGKTSKITVYSGFILPIRENRSPPNKKGEHVPAQQGAVRPLGRYSTCPPNILSLGAGLTDQDMQDMPEHSVGFPFCITGCAAIQ